MKKYKKYTLIAIINLLLLGLILCGMECYCYKLFTNVNKDYLESINHADTNFKLRYSEPKKYNYKHVKRFFKTNIGSSEKRPILFIGGSYTKGDLIKHKETLAYQIHKLTGRTVYKRGISGGGLSNILDQLETGTLKKEVPDAEYIIYTFIDAHIGRLFQYDMDQMHLTQLDVRYKLKNDKIVKVEPSVFYPLYKFYTVKYFQNILTEYRDNNERENNYPMFCAMMERIMELFKEQYPNSKIVVLMYPDFNVLNIEKNSKEDILGLPAHICEYLEELGYIVIDAENLTNKPIRKLEYRTTDNNHPNGKAWQEVAPALVKELNL